jgi:hypothetical protein
MKDIKWLLVLALIFIISSIALYVAQILIFHNAHETIFLLFQDLAFMPLHALLVVVILEHLLKRFAHQSMMTKLNMVVGVFFIEVGYELLRMFAHFDKTGPELAGLLQIGDKWTDKDFAYARKELRNVSFRLDAPSGYIGDMRIFFRRNRQTLMRLMENPNLLEHQSFTDMLLAVLHLGEELVARKNLKEISEADTKHLSGDMNRAYAALVMEWLSYMHHLNKEYPYLYSLAVRTNPYNPAAKAELS